MNDGKKRIISFKVCDLFLDLWFFNMIVFGVESLHKWIFLSFLNFLLVVNLV